MVPIKSIIVLYYKFLHAKKLITVEILQNGLFLLEFVQIFLFPKNL